MEGQLRDHPLAELIHEISEARLSGALRLARERARAAVYFEEGQIVAALTNLRPLRLVEFLRRAGAVEAARLDGVVGEGMSDEHAALALVRSGVIGAAELKKLQWRQSSEVLRELLRWTEGEWSFDPRVRLAGGLAGGNRAPLDTPRLLVEAARGLPHEEVALRMADEDETVAPAERAGGATHYAVLGVARSASPDEIKRVYYSLARRLHPDRFRRDADESQRQQIDAAFAKIAQAYETLKDAARRAAYDLKLSKQGDAAPAAGGADRQAGRVTGE